MTSLLVDLLQESRQRGFLGPGPVELHLDHARAFVVAVDASPSSVVDLGAGGGLPGLVLATEVWPETRWVFLDAQHRRAEFLTEAVAALDLGDRVEVVCERAEVFGRDPARRGRFDVVAARSFGLPAVAAECAAPLLRVGGRLVVSEPPDGSADRWPSEGLALLGLDGGQPVTVPGPPPVHLMVAVQGDPCPDRYPRRVGVPTKRPLF